MSLSPKQAEAIKILIILQADKKITKKPIDLCLKRDLAEDETEDSYRHGTSLRRYYFENGKFWHDSNCRWNKMIRESDKINEKSSAEEISPEALLKNACFKSYDYGFYGGNTSYVGNINDNNNWIEVAKTIDKFIRLNT